jgi:manganese/iron transport system substrate-binding protein
VLARVATDAGVRLGGPLYVDSLGEPGSGAETYIGMMRSNVVMLVDGLKGDA